MKLTPRAPEVKAIVDLLESDGYDSAEVLAKDIIKRVGELFAEREWFALAHRDKPGGLVLAWGPLSSDTEVQRFGKKLALGGEAISVKLYSTAAILDRVESSSAGRAALCTGCHHPIFVHQHEKYGGKCALRDCDCKYLEK